jgi:hypothetical protein
MLDYILKYLLGVILGAVITWCSVYFKKQKKIKDGVLAMLHDRLYQLCNEYIERGYCTVDERKNLEYLYSAYHGLGGNGTGTDLYNNSTKLPYNPPDEDNK